MVCILHLKKSESAVFVSNFVFWTKCLWRYCHKLWKVMFYREMYIKYKMHIWKCLLYGYALNVAQNLKERIALKSVSSEENWEKKCKKKSVKIMCELKCFWTVTVWWRSTFWHLFVSHFYIFYHLVICCITPSSAVCTIVFVKFSFNIKGKVLCVQK